MLDPLFPFIDPFVEPVVELSEDNNSFVIPVEMLLDFMQKIGMDKKPVEGEKIEVPIHIVLSLLRPEELEKLKRYIVSYENAPDS